MDHGAGIGAGLVVAIALAAGILAQSLARHLKLPGIVLLLAAGVLLGPDVAGVVDPHALGPALHVLVGFAVAVILFEGGLNLSLSRLRSQATVIQRLLTIGALVTAVGGAFSARWIMGWDWRPSIAFGALVVVTGPTVVTPLLRRIKVKYRVATVLEAEGVLIDAIGAVLAVVTLQVLISPSGSSIADGAAGVVLRLGFGLVVGLAGGALVALALRFRKVVPDGLENVFTLSLVLALFQASNALLPESGIMTVTAAGFVVGNARTRVRRELMEFKEQLTVMLIGMLFVLLAASVRLEGVFELGYPALLTIACLMFIVRPINIALCTIRTELTVKDRVFLSWIAPRGVVAAAISTLFAQAFDHAGIPGGEPLQALVFAVIAGTVLVQGLTGGVVARLLGLRRAPHRGIAIFGANALGKTIGRLMRDNGQQVVFLERDPIKCTGVEQDGFRVIYGNILDERSMQRAQLEDRTSCLAVTTNEEVNLLVART
ncbi:MAG: sodium:proton antiporter, partial [bacterium]|nr:sodium:proton antiporter [bacterium]